MAEKEKVTRQGDYNVEMDVIRGGRQYRGNKAATPKSQPEARQAVEAVTDQPVQTPAPSQAVEVPMMSPFSIIRFGAILGISLMWTVLFACIRPQPFADGIDYGLHSISIVAAGDERGHIFCYQVSVTPIPGDASQAFEQIIPMEMTKMDNSLPVDHCTWEAVTVSGVVYRRFLFHPSPAKLKRLQDQALKLNEPSPTKRQDNQKGPGISDPGPLFIQYC